MQRPTLQQELKNYNYRRQREGADDHAADALRYFFISSIQKKPVIRKWPFIIAGVIFGAILAVIAAYYLAQ